MGIGVIGQNNSVHVVFNKLIKIVIKGETLVFILDPESDMPMPCWFSMDDFGKTVFLTKEAAEAALKAKGGGAE